MDAVFVELPAFERFREQYLNDDQFTELQFELMANPSAGDVIPGSGGMRKMRFADARRGKGKRGGMRVIFYYWVGGPEFWLFTLYDKNTLDDLSKEQRSQLHRLLKAELLARRI